MAWEWELSEWRAAVADLTEWDYAHDEPNHDEHPAMVGAVMDVETLCRDLERQARQRREQVSR